MTKEQIDELVEKYKDDFDPNSYKGHFSDTQYDNRSASINYAMIREHKPKVVVEFGTRLGRCTRDIYCALRDNEEKFKFFPYEIDGDLRRYAQGSLVEEFRDEAPFINGDVMKSKIPKNIDYLFLDHSHEEAINEWVMDYLLPNHCADGCIVQIHDLPLSGDWDIKPHGWKEAQLLKELHLEGKLPLEKIYWTYEEGEGRESTWWEYQS